MNRTQRTVVQAIRDGTNLEGRNFAVALGAVITTDEGKRGRQRELRHNGILIATLGSRMFIRIPSEDKQAIEMLDVLVKEFFGPHYGVGMTRRRLLFASHPKLNSITNKWAEGTTFLDIHVWWEVPGMLKLDCSIADER